MPNHVSNIITVCGDWNDAVKLVNSITDEKGDFDFNRLVPMPERLNIPNSSIGFSGRDFLNGDTSALDGMAEKSREEALVLGRKYLDNIADFGYPTWYEWRRAKWGTKWNAYDCEVEGNTISFSTALNAPLLIYKALAEKFPANDFEILFADEDVGANTGHILIRHGESPDVGAHQSYPVRRKGEA